LALRTGFRAWEMRHTSGMKVQNRDGVAVYSFPLLDPWPDLTQAAFGRTGGVSDPPCDTLNVSFAVQDDPERVRANRERMARAVGWDPAHIVSALQVHGRRVAAVGREHLRKADLADTDALVTGESGILLLLKFADCAPVVLWDPVRRVVGLAHAGWKGTVLGIPAATVEFMARTFGSSPADIMAGIGPSIGPCCYRVGPEVASVAERGFAGAGVVLRDADGGAIFDLWSANAETLMRAGVLEENIAIAGICTRCRHDLFFSHRAVGGKLTGRFGVVVGIRDE